MQVPTWLMSATGIVPVVQESAATGEVVAAVQDLQTLALHKPVVAQSLL